MASVERTAYPRFARTISSRELHEAFTPGPSEVAWARGKARSAEHVLALLVLLKSFQKLGYFPDLAEVPQPVVEHVRGLLGMDEGVEPRHDSVRTAARQRDFIRDRLGVVCDKERAREIASKAIYEAVQTKDNPADLINVALEKLVKARLELPGYTTLNEMASSIRTEVNEEFFARIVARMDEAGRSRLLELLRISVFGWAWGLSRRSISSAGTVRSTCRAPAKPVRQGRPFLVGELDRCDVVSLRRSALAPGVMVCTAWPEQSSEVYREAVNRSEPLVAEVTGTVGDARIVHASPTQAEPPRARSTS
ncbi:DUF4158 domain-containing protein [Streptomyces sp. NPDC020667]|uniref:DUF4158 domain-containing protein n=1 Tax=Streptomyces sp. NPDC020667 TaxID=3154895 RepID=UPI0033FEB5A1